MAPALTTPATGAVASPVASDGKAAAVARSVGLGLPALPPLPGLASHGQPRVASFCKRLARNVVAMAAGEPAAPMAANAELTEFINTLKQEWERIEDKYAVTTLAVAATLGMWSAGGVVSAIDRLPVVPGLMELVGIGYSGGIGTYANVTLWSNIFRFASMGTFIICDRRQLLHWFAYRNLIFKPDREAFFAKVRDIYEDIISG